MRRTHPQRFLLRRHWVCVACAFLLGCVFPRLAKAENPFARLPQLEDGPGIRVGQSSSLHPGFALLFGFDNNVFSQNAQQETPRSAVHLTPSGWIGIGNRRIRGGRLDSPSKPTARMVDYALRLQAGYRVYLNQDEAIKQASKLNLGAIARISIAPGRRFSFDIDEDLQRLGEPANFETSSDLDFSRFSHASALRFTLRPGGGRLALSAAYLNQVLRFKAQEIATSDRIVNGFEHETSYRVRDRSALVARYQFLQTYYTCCDELGKGRNEDSRAHRVAAGYAGQVGRKWMLEALGGYAHLTYIHDPNGPNARQITGNVALSYFPTLRTELRLNGFRKISDAVFGNYYIDLGASLFASHVFQTRTKVMLGGAMVSRKTGGLPEPGTESDIIERYVNAPGLARRDLLLSGYAQVEQAIGKLFVLALRYNAAADNTDFVVFYQNGYVDYAQFSRHQIMLIGAVRY